MTVDFSKYDLKFRKGRPPFTMIKLFKALNTCRKKKYRHRKTRKMVTGGKHDWNSLGVCENCGIKKERIAQLREQLQLEVKRQNEGMNDGKGKSGWHKTGFRF